MPDKKTVTISFTFYQHLLASKKRADTAKKYLQTPGNEYAWADLQTSEGNSLSVYPRTKDWNDCAEEVLGILNHGEDTK